MITKDELDTETGEVRSLDTTGENSARVTVMEPCGTDCPGCPHGPFEYQVQRDGTGFSWEYVGAVAGSGKSG